jgi:hypothetical protein
MYRPMQMILLRVPFERVWVAFGSPSMRLLFCRRSSLFTGDRLRLGGLLALSLPLLPRFPPSSLFSPALSIRCRLTGESDILVVELL